MLLERVLQQYEGQGQLDLVDVSYNIARVSVRREAGGPEDVMLRGSVWPLDPSILAQFLDGSGLSSGVRALRLEDGRVLDVVCEYAPAIPEVRVRAIGEIREKR